MAAFLPATVFYLFPVSSHAVGLLLVCLILMGLAAIGGIRVLSPSLTINWLTMIGVAAAGLLAHGVIAHALVPSPITQLMQSLVFLAVMLIAIYLLASIMQEAANALPQAMGWVTLAFAVSGILGALRLQPPGASIALSFEKSVFPFTEPSQFAIAFSTFLLHACVTSRGWRTLAWLGFAGGLALMLQSLSVMVAVTLAALITLPIFRLAVFAAVGGAMLTFVDLQYYLDRLDFGAQGINGVESLSRLVYRQGLELASDAFQRSSGWGIGFNQLGSAPFSSPTADLIYRILRNDSNLRDGGFTAAKLVSELGVIGILIMLLYVFAAGFSALALRRYALGRLHLAPAQVVGRAAIVGVSIELMVRGQGYFSGSLFIAAAAVMLLYMDRSRKREAMVTTE
ncbi:hypothetical protein PIB19_22380 [Sphingomonas sp. 7/4-4]|uniref:hypothetical protein n=1 Tax=Sphingomonas sp. 7/4-4 TaxID=3018446 RepID=UPI0022F38856|nr:hypothetical protein [Sphingomonas sp. 7/4-4]WBY07955.1 hypothetical protein PIB19_22380 [Sphingomonas sp. 7/4-4]